MRRRCHRVRGRRCGVGDAVGREGRPGSGGRSTREGSSLIAPAHLGLEWSREAGQQEAGAAAALELGRRC